MAIQWFYQTAGQQSGPVGLTELRRLADSDIVKADTSVRKACTSICTCRPRAARLS